MFKSFTSSENKPAATGKKATRDPSALPAPVQRASRWMFFGAVGSILWGIYWVIVAAASKSSLVEYNNSLPKSKQLTASQINSQFGSSIAFLILEALVFAGLWVLMSRMTQAGRNWARITSSALFALWSWETYQTIVVVRNGIEVGDLLLTLAIWGFGLTALYFLWRPESTEYFKPASQ